MLATFVRSHRSLLSFAPLCYARFTTLASTHSLCNARFATLASLYSLCHARFTIYSLCYASFATLTSLTLFTGSLTHFAHSLVGQLKFLNMCSRCYRVSQEQTRFWRSLETRPLSLFISFPSLGDNMLIFLVPPLRHKSAKREREREKKVKDCFLFHVLTAQWLFYRDLGDYSHCQ